MFSSHSDVGYKKIQLLSTSGSSPSFTIFESTSILAVSQITSAQPHCISMARDVTNPNCPQVSLLLSAAMNAILGLCMDMDTGKKDIFADTSEASEVQLNAVEFRNYRTQCCLFRGVGLVSQYPPAVSQYPRRAKLWRACSRFYRNRFMQVNTHLKALAEIYTIHTFPRISNL